MSQVAIQLVTRRQSTTILRDANAGTTDAGGQSLPPDWEPYLTDVPCFAWSTTAREPDNQGRIVVVENRRAILQSGTDVTEADQLGDVVQADGTVLLNGPMNILSVMHNIDHLELLLEDVR